MGDNDRMYDKSGSAHNIRERAARGGSGRKRKMIPPDRTGEMVPAYRVLKIVHYRMGEYEMEFCSENPTTSAIH